MSISATTARTGRRRATRWWIAVLAVLAVVAAGISMAVAAWRSPEPFTGHTGFVLSVATGELDGTQVVASGGRDDTVWVWDLTTGQPISEPLTDHTGNVTTVAIGDQGRTPVVVSGSRDETMRVWDLTTGKPIGEPFPHPGPVGAVATGELAGAPIAVTASAGQLRIWDLATREPIGEPFGPPVDSDAGPVRLVALGEWGGRPVVVSGGHRGLESTVRVWDLASGAPAGEPLVAPGIVQSVAVGELDGDPVVVSGSADDAEYEHGLIRVWDLATGEPVVEPFGDTSRWPWGEDIGYGPVAVTEVDGGPVIVSGGFDHRVRVWDLGTGKERTPSRA